jgi:hypothetical protein
MRSLLIVTILILAPLTASALDQYQFTVENDLSAVEVTACFEGQAPAQLYRHRDAHRFTQWLRLGKQDINPSSRHVSLRSLSKGDCASWRVDLAAATKTGDYRLALAVNEALLTAGSLWFWRDTERRKIEVRSQLPAGMQFSSPWPTARGQNNRDDDAQLDGITHYFPAETSASWTSRLALGKFATGELELGEAKIQLAMLGAFNPEKQLEMQQWIKEPAQAVVGVIGQFPQQQTQVLLIDVGARSSAVTWAHVIRGGGMAVEFFIDASRPLEDFRRDWTATHELSHLLLPYVSSQDRWLSEGLASYYQNILRARDGRLNETQAWEKLLGGFQRGEKDSRREGTMSTYWRGASMLLQADARLRAASGGQQSLDSALALLHHCCHDPGRRWLAFELFEKLDALTGYSVFGEIYARHAWDDGFPDPQPTLEKLGVDSQQGVLKLNDKAPWSNIRQLIMKKPMNPPGIRRASSAAAQ